jgi:hypothetical protein
MTSSVRIDGSLPAEVGTTGIIFSRSWAVDYDFAGTPQFRANQPRRLSEFGVPAPYDSELEGALRGRGAFSQFLYLFKNGRYQRLIASTMSPDGPDRETGPAWGLPAAWTSLDAIVPGRGSKINFAYFCRGSEYMRYDWVRDRMSDNYPKTIGGSWQMSPPFDANLDGIIAGQDTLGNRMFLFNTVSRTVDITGALASSGETFTSPTLGFARYDFTSGGLPNPEVDPRNVVAKWGVLIPLLDAGEAIDIANGWCRKALTALTGPMSSLLSNALAHHFRTATPSAQQLSTITARMTAVRDRLLALPDKFQWTRSLPAAASTHPGLFTQIGDDFSNRHGPNGRAAVLIHEAVHFILPSGSLDVDVPEWSGATVNGVLRDVVPPDTDRPTAVTGIAYDAMTVDQAIANPSSYAAFAQEIAFNGIDTRFGGGRPHE